MPRLWLDTDFVHHRKLLELGNPNRRWTWLEVLTYTCRFGSAHVPAAIREVIPKATTAFLADCERVGLLDRENGELYVHDWHLFQGTVEERVAAYLEHHPGASANEVQQAVAGKREAVLAAVKRNRESGSPEPPEPGTREPPEVVPTDSGSDSGSNPKANPQSPPSYEGTDFEPLTRLKHACHADGSAALKLDRAAKGCSEADIVWALEACKGPGVRDRLAVALSELKKRKEAA